MQKILERFVREGLSRLASHADINNSALPARREFLAGSALAALAALGCGRAQPGNQQAAAPPEQELAPFLRCERAAHELISKGVATVEHLNPDAPLVDPAFIVGFHHFNPAGSIQTPQSILHREYLAVEILVSHGFTRIGIDGNEYGVKIPPEKFEIKPLDGGPIRPMTAEELRSKLRYPDYFAQFTKQAYAQGIDPLGPLISTALEGRSTLMGLEDPEALRKTRALEGEWVARERRLNEIIDLVREGHQIDLIRTGASMEVKLGPKTFPLADFKRTLEFHANKEMIGHPANRERERLALGFDLDVYLLGYDHLAYLSKHKVDRAVFIVRAMGSQEYEELRNGTTRKVMELLREIGAAERFQIK